MVELIVLEMAAARQRAKRAELSLKEAKAMLGENRGLAISLALCSRIRAGQARAKAARRRLLKLVPPSMH
ncbi:MULTISPECIES: hypothetical protein [unclassified Mesorhizobium]|uniref:hypothetical protein n=1 Tax=unclassified Mesorhizobium TaxID=325217 RepID=UPI000FCC9C1E|nr:MULTISPECIES: hypothetical protein [unclassified Mesorhizobium]TIT78505.1 MAG: hypothetical protein E5W57_10885 [Mesorhizobium sp.]TGP26737.1 hypothetical protein EN874_003480 [Mesorhizobium sp. M1D.F.Ca.ET.231.01.1.1]TGP38694.1 hypothetical protein EN877_03480 [Mesorhizobium sp. M1D.F.Ca.ET.234.01.1.1]TGS50903.1 hypothetical protein EN827_03480 [Mesorhizobium sp. M1D.F.Ca.ET.184.01.1.1]TGS66788.1 hypothetical protein EN826_003480 [Mesorhizobium sp. M1D.F.Ca.ET.183.01.1.1]